MNHMNRITGRSFTDLEELRLLIDHMIECAKAQGNHHPSTVYTGDMYATLFEETLTDGSHVMNVIIRAK